MALDPWVVSVLVSLLLLSIGIILMILEAKIGHGLLAVCGIGCVIIAVVILFQLQVPLESQAYAYYADAIKYTIITTCVVLGVFFGYVAYKGYQVRKLKSKLGPQSLIGKIGIAKTDIDPKGQVNVEGELWSAVCNQKPYAYEGEDVEIIGYDGLTLQVRPATLKSEEKETAEEEVNKPSKSKKTARL
ncbi:MAG: NfeD family protein [Candidatus Freyarchaeum deiterrae]